MVLRILDRFEEILLSFLIAAAVVLIFVAVVHRYSVGIVADVLSWARASNFIELQGYARSFYRWLVSINLTWAQEACIYLFVWMAKFGAAYGVRLGIHVGVDVLVERMSPKNQRLMIIIAFLACILFTAIVAWIGTDFVWHISKTGQISADLEMPMWIVYLAVPLGSALMCFRFIQALWIYLTTGAIAHHDHGHVDGLEDEEAAQ
ncbi:TRAP transporter small permease [Pseudochrobactrum sp. HB0163]|uniref:TRAP transporter small permease n=1 Tax=Pseudochrobactrum sp. HB0163 TaxID=3450708 RepID=UPI003F6E1502